MEEKQKKTFKSRFIIMSVIVGIFFIAGITLTFVLKAKQANLEKLKGQNYELEQQISQKELEYNYVNSDDYLKDYWKNEEDKSTNDGDKIIPIA